MTADASSSPPASDSSPLLDVVGLNVSFGDRTVVHHVSLGVQAGEAVALVGESGSGKSVTARSLVGLPGPGARVTADRLLLHEHDALALRERDWRAVRGLDPLRPVGKEIEDALRQHRHGDRTARRERVLQVMAQAGIPEPQVRASQHPHELSGGLRQRALIASALALDPPLLIADEPTTALDATVQTQIIDLLAESVARGRGLLFITHDLAVVRRLADRVAVMRGGRIVEQGPAEEVLTDPQHAYTRELLAADPSGHPRGTRLTGSAPRTKAGTKVGTKTREKDPAPILEAKHLVKTYGDRTAVGDVSFTLHAGRTLGIVGESGSGKSTTARIALGLTRPESGEVTLHGEEWSAVREKDRRSRRHGIQLVPQDPLSSFDPRWTVRRSIADAVRLRIPNRPEPTTAEVAERIEELAGQVGLPFEALDRHPLQLSGGQRQRAALARVLAPRPRVLVLDEPVSALDATVQAQVLDLLSDLQESLNVGYLFISHDLGVVRHMSDDVLVMKDGRVVESGPAERLFAAPEHPYTRQLLESVLSRRSDQPTGRHEPVRLDRPTEGARI
jgi:peptide/nickel transport system ATP-binding protein